MKTVGQAAQDKPRHLPKRSTSMPADVTQYARLWNQLSEGSGDGQSSGQTGRVEDVQTLLNQFRFDSRQQSDQQSTTDNQHPCEDSDHSVDVTSKTARSQTHSPDVSCQQSDPGSQTSRCGKCQWHDEGSLQSLASNQPSFDTDSQQSCDNSPQSTDLNQVGDVKASEDANQQFTAQPVTSNKQDIAGDSQHSSDARTSDADNQRHPVSGELREDIADHVNNNACEGTDRPSSSKSTTNKDSVSTASAQSPLAVDKKAKDSATHSDGTHAEGARDQQLYHADVSSSSSEDCKRLKNAGSENSRGPQSWTPPFANRHPFRFKNNRGRGYFVNRPPRGDNFFGNLTFSGFPANAAFPGYIGPLPNRRRANHTKSYYGPSKGYAYQHFAGSGGQCDKMWTPRSVHRRPGVVSSAWPRRGRGGVMMRGRAGFSPGRGGAFNRARIAEGGFSFSPSYVRRDGTRLGGSGFGRKAQDWNFRGRQEESEGSVYFRTRNGDGPRWDGFKNDGFSRGRTPYRTNLEQPACRHRSAPPSYNMAEADSMLHRPRQRHRSLSRSPRHSAYRHGGMQPYASRKQWSSSPKMFLPHFSDKEPHTPQRNYGPHPRFWLRETNAAWHDKRTAPQWSDCLHWHDHSATLGQQDIRQTHQQSNGSYSHRPDCETCSPRQGASAELGVSQKPANLDTFEQQAQPQELSPKNGVKMALEVIRLAQQDDPSVYPCLEKTDTSPPFQDGSARLPLQNGSALSPPQDGSNVHPNKGIFSPHLNNESHGKNQQEQTNQQLYRPRQRDGARATHGRDRFVSTGLRGSTSPKWSGRPSAVQWRDRPQTSKYNSQQHTHRQFSGQQQHYRPPTAQRPERLFESEHKGSNSAVLSKGTNVAHWHQHVPRHIHHWVNETAASQRPDNSATIQQQTGSHSTVWTAGSTAPPTGDQHADFMWKIMQLQVLHEQQHIDQVKADSILRTLMGMHLPSQASQSMKTLLGSHLCRNHSLQYSQQGKIQESSTVHSCSEYKKAIQQRNLPNGNQRGSCQNLDRINSNIDDRINSNQNFAFSIVQQKNNGNQPVNYISYITPSQSQDTTHPNRPGIEQAFHTNSSLGNRDQRDEFQGNRQPFPMKEKQQWRKQVKESRSQYVYFLDNLHPKNNLQEQDTNQNRPWNYQTVNQFSSSRDVNSNQPCYLSPVGHKDQGHKVHYFQQQDQNAVSPHRNYADQTRSPYSANLKQSPTIVHEGMKTKHQVSEDQLSFADKTCMMQQHGSQASSGQTPRVSPTVHDNAREQTGVEINGNGTPAPTISDGRPQLQPVPNTSQPIQMGVGPFLHTRLPLPTPLLPTGFQSGPVNSPLFQHVNAPIFHPLPSPFIQTMTIPYPQQSVFQFPSPIPMIPVGNPGQVASSPGPNIFQFPDTAAIQQPPQVDVDQSQQQNVQPQTPCDRSYGFAGNQPLVQLPPANHTSCVPSDPRHPPHLGTALGVADVNGNAFC